MPVSIKLEKITEFLNGELQGDGDTVITGIAPLETAGVGDISFLANSRYLHFLQKTGASALLLPRGEWQLDLPFIICDNPYFGFTKLMQHFYPGVQKQNDGIHSDAGINKDVNLGKNVSIGAFVVIESGVKVKDGTTIFPGCYIGRDCQIGKNVTIYPNVTIREEVEIGDNVILHSGTVIGCDGFGFAQEKSTYHKIPQIGRVVIEKNVEIGANCCIDRATLGETRIHRGSKLDNLIQIAHNVEIGEHSVIAAQTGISGSTKIGNGCMFGGQVGLVGHITIGDQVICGAQAGVTKSIPDKTFVSGYPARPHRQQLKLEAALLRLPEALRRLKKVEQKIAESEGNSDNKK